MKMNKVFFVRSMANRPPSAPLPPGTSPDASPVLMEPPQRPMGASVPPAV